MRACKLTQIGIGDLTHVACEVLLSGEDSVDFSLCRESLETFRERDSKEYSVFIESYLRTVLHNKRVNFVESKDHVSNFASQKSYQTYLDSEMIHNHFKSVFSRPSRVFGSDYIVISTKARNYDVESFNSLKKRLFEGINSMGMIVVLMGEREVEANWEYRTHGTSMIYSIYPDAIHLLDPSLVVDLTIPKLGMTTPEIDRLVGEISIAYSSRAAINIGIGGFFGLVGLSRKLRSLVSIANGKETLPDLPGLLGQITFADVNSLLQSIQTSSRD